MREDMITCICRQCILNYLLPFNFETHNAAGTKINLPSTVLVPVTFQLVVLDNTFDNACDGSTDQSHPDHLFLWIHAVTVGRPSQP